jgi:hypothetical protein
MAPSKEWRDEFGNAQVCRGLNPVVAELPEASNAGHMLGVTFQVGEKPGYTGGQMPRVQIDEKMIRIPQRWERMERKKRLNARPIPLPWEPIFMPEAVDATTEEATEVVDHEKKNRPKSSKVVDSGATCDLLLDAVPSLYYIKRVVAKAYGVTMLDMESARRTANIVRPRQIAGYLCATMTRRSLPAIGRAFGNRDHTTQLHSKRKIAALRAADPVFDAEIETLKTSILETFNE